MDQYINRTLWITFYPLLAVGSLYAVFILCLTRPAIQKFALYAHKFHTAYFFDITKPEAYGFAKRQVTPFYIWTADNERLFAWHVLPVGLYAQHEHELVEEPAGLRENITSTKAFRLLKSDAKSLLVVNFHGNAGHVAEGLRPSALRALSAGSSQRLHILTFDYRGFSLSSGQPSEEGLIRDGIAVVEWAINVAGIAPERIVLLGQSLGTAVASAVALHFARGPSPPPDASLLPAGIPAARRETDLAGLVLVAPFTRLLDLLNTYRIAGIVPILSPLQRYPSIQKWLGGYVVETWDTTGRIEELFRLTAGGPQPRRLILRILHALNDAEINWQHGAALFKSAVRAAGSDQTLTKDFARDEGYVDRLNGGAKRRARLDILPYGGHNRIVSLPPVAAAVMRTLMLSSPDQSSPARIPPTSVPSNQTRPVAPPRIDVTPPPRPVR